MTHTPVRTVGYIGMGIMGSSMARNLIKAGFDVTVSNRTRAKTAGFPKVADSPRELAAGGVQVICINVTNTPDVREVIFGPAGIIHGVKPGAGHRLIVIDHSTIDPLATKEMAEELAKIGIDFLDAPVSGGDIGARNCTLSIMVGGTPEAFQLALPVFQAMGKTIAHVGASGAGQVCKACNQIAVANALMGVCEAIAMAKWSGLDPAKMVEVVAGGAAQSWQLANLGPKILAGDYAPGFMVNLARKDLNIVAEAASRMGLSLKGVTAASAYFKEVIEEGGGNLGTQAMSQAVGKK